MNAKLIIFFLLTIGFIVHSSWAIQIFPERNSDEDFTKSEVHGFKDDVNMVDGSSRSVSPIRSSIENEEPSSSSRELSEEPPDHEIPYSEHENPKEVSTKPKYVAPGEWAKPPKEKNIPLDFVPTKLYAQVRGTHTVKHAPREEAIKDAETDEEKLNALRLREVVKNSKINTVYTEEGYEDSAYDHAGHIRDADFHEGFARKLRDQLKQKHEEEKGNSEELTDYEDDYSDHDEKDEANSSDNHLRSYVNPKSIVQNEIEVLVEDVEKDAEEAEEASDINLFDSKKVKELKNPEKKSGYYSQENEPQDTRIIENENDYNVNPSDRERYETTTTYEPVQETISDRSFQSLNEPNHYNKENPTTIAYGQVLWDFFKTQKNEPVESVQKEVTTSSPFLYQPTSISTMTLTIPGPYFFSMQQETTTPSPIFPASQTYHPRGLDSDLVNTGLIASISQNNDQVWPMQTSSFNYIGRMDNPAISLTPSSILNPEESWKPLMQSTFNYSILNNFENKNEPGTTSLPENIEATTLKNEEIRENSNDYINPLLQDTPIKVDQKKKYRVLVRHKPQKSTRTPKSYRSHEEDHVKNVPNDMTGYDKFVNDQRAKYLKVLNYVTNQDRAKGSKNFGVARAPVASRSKEVRYFDFRAEDRPADVDQPSVPIESETIMREPIDKKLPRNRPISSVDGFLGTSSSLPIYKIDPFPLLDLSPPLLPSPRYNRNKYRPLSLTYNNNRHYRDIEPILKYAPVIVDLTRKSRERRKRSMEYVKGERNNGTTNRETRKRDYDKTISVTKDGRRNLRLAEEPNDGDIRESDYADKRIEKVLRRSRRSGRTHEELLGDSPRVSSHVIDKEIEERFKGEKDGDKLENVKNVEVEVPDFDYVEEFASEKEEKQPIDTKITLDLKKYPFYVNERIEDLSGLKYAIDPKKVPRKTATGMEFYDSRDRYKDCEEVEGNLDEVLPQEEKPSADRGPNENGPRLRGLGDKLDCFKAKYFDENPFDNPLFIEKNVGDPNLPKELDPRKLSERILVLPAGNDDYIFQKLSRKPEERNFSDGRSERKYNNDQLEKNRRPSRPYSARNSKGHQRAPKKQQRKERVASLLNLSTEPYHKQVYEDVMNHITGSNDPYRIYGTTTVKPLSQVQVAASNTNLKTSNSNLNELINTTTWIDIGNHENNTEIDGLLPPKNPNNFVRQSNPGTKRIILTSRRRSPRYYVPRTIARYHAIKIKKRSIDRPKVQRVLKTDDLVAEESETYTVTSRPRRRKFSISSRNLTSSTEKSITDDPENEPSSKIIYTIRDRIRYSKPKDELKNVGKFTATPSAFDEDTRRKEPRYNSIRRKPSGVDASTVPTILSTIWTDKTTIKESTTPNSISNKRLQYATLSRDRSRKNLNEDSTEASNKYEVHENVDDESVTTPLPIVSTSSEYSNVKEYLNSDPPGYKEAFSEETTEFPTVEETRSKEPNEDLKETSKEDEGSADETTEQSYESKEDISEKKEEDHEEAEEETNDSSEASEESKEEDRTFFHYSSRPYSPPENYEDEKYSDLGKRINKPAFYHPPFSMLGYERSRLEESSEEDVEDEDEEDSAENKKKTRFALLPWSAEKEGHEKSFGESKYYSRPFWSYEYPWERRERLERGEREKGRERKGRSGRKSYGGFGDFHSKDSDEDVSSSKQTGSRVYPWDLYDVPSRKNRKSRRERYFDADGSGSEHKPVKYSSKYNSSLLGSISNLNNSNRFAIDPERITKEKNQLGSAKETNKSSNIRRILSGTLVPEAITQRPKKDAGRKGKTDERNSIEVTSVTTAEQKKRKNVMRKETQHEEANSTTQSPTSTTENTNKSNITDRPNDGSRRRRILKKYSTSNVADKDNSTERKEHVKRRRGKIRSTTAAPSTTTTTITPSTKLSRRRPQTRSRESDNKFSTSKVSAPTPSTTTVEHRSRVSKESFVSRTTYPDNENSTSHIDNEPETFETKYRDQNDEIDRNRGNITSENVERISVMTKETPDHVYQTKKIDKDGVKEMFISIMPNKAGNVSELDSDSSEFDDEEDRWKIPREESEDLGEVPSTESYLVGNFLGQSTETHSRNDREFEDENTKLEDEEERDEKEDKSETKSTIKFIRHPERRLYYYVERRR